MGVTTLKKVNEEFTINGKKGTPDTIEIGVAATGTLVKMLGIINSDVSIGFKMVNVREQDKYASMILRENSVKTEYMLADLSVIRQAPSLKQIPEYEIELEISPEFVESFIKGKAGLPDSKTFTVMKEDDKFKVVIGHSTINTNKITIFVSGESTVEDINAISFSADFLREILLANKDATVSKMEISTRGLCHIHFDSETSTTDYYLVEMDLED